MKSFDDKDALRDYVNERVRELAAIHGPAFSWNLQDWTMEPDESGFCAIVRVPCCGEVIEARLDLVRYLPAASVGAH
jgi:hypothetical protein